MVNFAKSVYSIIRIFGNVKRSKLIDIVILYSFSLNDVLKRLTSIKNIIIVRYEWSNQAIQQVENRKL